MVNETTFVRTENETHHFLFRCEGCKTFGELEIPIPTSRFSCPEDCGAVYILWTDPLRNQPALMCVVRPVFVDDEDEDLDDADDCAYCDEWSRCECFD